MELSVHLEVAGKSVEEQIKIIQAKALADTANVLLPQQFEQLERLAIRYAINNIGADRLFTAEWFLDYTGMSIDEGNRISRSMQLEKEELEKLIARLRVKYLSEVAKAIRNAELEVVSQLRQHHRKRLTQIFGYNYKDPPSYTSSVVVRLLSRRSDDLSVFNPIYYAVIIVSDDDSARKEIKLTKAQNSSLSEKIRSIDTHWQEEYRNTDNAEKRKEIANQGAAMVIEGARNIMSPEQFYLVEVLATRFAINRLGIAKIFRAKWFLGHVNMSSSDGEAAYEIADSEQKKLEKTIGRLQSDFQKKVDFAISKMERNVLNQISPEHRNVVTKLFEQPSK